MSLFGALYIGDSGLRTSQNALNTTAHNLSNINTIGYVRQQVAQSDSTYTNVSRTQSGYNVQIGDGVKYSECRHIRDAFLDETYREENGRYGFYDVSYSAILEVEDIMGEFDGAALRESISGLWVAMQEIAKSPSDTTNISMLVSKAASFVENATSVYKSFKEYQVNLNDQVKKAITEINEIGKRIDELNKEISKIEVGGLENANDLRDERDFLIDNLAGYGNINYQEDIYGVVTIQFNGTDFVTSGRANEMKYTTDKDTGFVTPYWEHNLIWVTNAEGDKVQDYRSAQVFDLTEEISSARDTDIGSLRALLLARGDHVANYTDLTTDICTDKKLEALQITEEQYNEKYGNEYYNDYIAGSVIMNMQAEFDNLVHAIATKVNEVIAQNADPVSGYLCNADGTPIQMFLKISSEPYETVMLSPAEKAALEAEGEIFIEKCDEKGEVIPHNYYRFIPEDPKNVFSLYNCENLQINQELVQVPVKLGFVKEDASSDYNLGKAFVEAFQNKGIYLNPNATAMSTYEGCYTDLMSQVSTSGDVFKELYEFQQLSIEQAESERQTVIGVSSDEELERMIMYQNAYNAASRYINVVNSLLDSLINMAV